MRVSRTNLIYGNCRVYSPEGELMFRCVEKRARWYLERNLAVIKEEDPLSIQLTFHPKGKGERQSSLKEERENKCVVCGEKNLNLLTKHHLIPYEYRQYFLPSRKNHSSAFVIPICVKCHFKYEKDFATKLKQKLAVDHNAPFNGFSKERSLVKGAIHTLKKHHSKLPPHRAEFLKQKICMYFVNKNVNIDFNEKETINNLNEFIKAEESNDAHKHGKLVVERYQNLDAFESMWVKDFMSNMKPQYMPEYLINLIQNAV